MEAITGKTLVIITPSKFKVTIREQDGGDDEVISKIKDAKDGSAVNNFISGIITDYHGTKAVTPLQISKWKNKDKYYVLFKSRVFSLGTKLQFKHKCPNTDCEKETNYDEDLAPYDRDFSKKDEESKTDFKYQVTPYPQGEALEAELTLTSGKKVKYTYLNGDSETKLLAANKDEISKNTELLVRNIQWFNEGKWQPLQNFKAFSARDMSEIRKHVKQNDEQFDAASKLVCPYCKKSHEVALMSEPDFFFPQETL